MSTEEGESTASGADHESVGALLAAARASTGLSIAQVAQRLHCGPDLIEALESNRFAELGAPVFARGHLRRYSELLGLPIDEMLARLARQENRDPPLPDLTQVPRAQSVPLDLRAMRPVAMGAGAVLVFGVLIWAVLTQSPIDSDRATPSTSTSTAASTESNVRDSASPPSPASLRVEARADAGTETSTRAKVSASSQTEAVARSEASASTGATDTPAVSTEESASWPPRASVIAQRGGFSLAISVTESCWIEIYDKDNNPLFYDMAQPGRRIQVSGAAPLRVRLGLADVVSLEFLGRRTPVPADLIRESLAHFTLASDGTFRRYRPVSTVNSSTESRPSGS